MATSKTVPPASAHSTITATRPTHALNNAPTSATLMTARSWLTFTWFWCTQMTTLTVTTLTVAAAIVATTAAIQSDEPRRALPPTKAWKTTMATQSSSAKWLRLNASFKSA